MKNLKKYIFTAILLGNGSTSVWSQNIHFEDNDYQSIGVFDAWENSPFRTGKLTGNVAIVNSYPEIHTKQKDVLKPNGSVLAVQRSRYASNQFGAKIDLKQPLRLTTATRYLHVMIYTPKKGRAMLLGLGKRADRPSQSKEVIQFSNLSLMPTRAGEWSEAVFPFNGNDNVDIYSWVIVPDAESTHNLAQDFAAYIDEIRITDKPTLLSENTDYPLNFFPTQTYTRNDRGVLDIRSGSKTIKVEQDITKNKTLAYRPLLNETLSVRPGGILIPSIGYKGTWMNGFVYIDYNHNGKFDVDVAPNGIPTKNSDLVSYSFYNSKNSKGQQVNGNSVANGRIQLPSITIPQDLPFGFYRMRFKVDWNNVDPGGDAVDIIKNGGGIVDVRLNIHDTKVHINQLNRNGEITTIDGTPIDHLEVPFGEPITVKLVPSKGFSYNGIRIRHGYHLDGDSLINSTPQYEDVIIPSSRFNEDNTVTLPKELIDGDILLEGLFVEKGTEIKNIYTTNFDKTLTRSNQKRNIESVSMNDAVIRLPQPDKMYQKLNECFVLAPHATVKPRIGYLGNWMSAYLYADYNNNGRFLVKRPNSNGTLGEANEMISYSGLSVGDHKYNSAGESLSNLNTTNMPSFTLPDTLKEGYYTFRYKTDWDSEDPQGSTNPDNHIVQNSGGIIDVRVRVTSATNVHTQVISDKGTLSTADGTPLANASLPIGKGFTVLSEPTKGYKLTKVIIRHGILNADPKAEPTPQVATDSIIVDAHAGGLFTVSDGLVDGDMIFYPQFEKTTDADSLSGYYQLIFNDEFNQPDNSTPDPNKWSVSPKMKSTWNRFISKDLNKVAYIKDNALLCRAIANPDKTSNPDDMISGAVQTSNHFAFTYGRVDVRLKTNLHTGNFPAAWMMPQHPTVAWPECGEIDIFESINSSKRAFHTVHSKWTYTLGNKNNPVSGRNEVVDVSQWHTYSLIWTKDKITWLLDGKEVHSYAKSTNENALNNGQWPFNYDFFLILNQSVGDGSWASKPDLNYTYETYFDYIRVYSLRPYTTTGISAIEQNPQDNTIYDLHGRRVTNPTKGVYIINHKKVVF